MKLLAIHAEKFSFEVTKPAMASAPEKILKKGNSENCLVLFTSFEKEDQLSMVQNYLIEVEKITGNLNIKNVVLYPYAHLSNNLASKELSLNLLDKISEKLHGLYNVIEAPFGWYKQFDIKTKGHALSESNRDIQPFLKLKKSGKNSDFVYSNCDLDQSRLIKSAYVLGSTISSMYGSKILGVGFYLDHAYVDLTRTKLTDLKPIEKKFRSTLKLEFKNSGELDNDFQKEMHEELCNVHSIGGNSFVSMFDFDSKVNVFSCKILNTSLVYWRNNFENKQITRVYFQAFESKEEEISYMQELEKRQELSHININKKQKLFVQSDLVGAGLPLMTPKGTTIQNEIRRLLIEMHEKNGYSQVITPHICKSDLYKKSGHWDKYADELFKVKGKYGDFVMKPMNCPHHMEIFKTYNWSYKDLPQRYFEFGTCYRDEKSGELQGLTRVRALTIDDCHIFLRESQLKDEIKCISDFIFRFYETFNFKKFRLSLQAMGDDFPKYIGELETWKNAEKILSECAEDMGYEIDVEKNEAAFYGPKISFLVEDSMGREYQLATIQLDFILPERFDLFCLNESGEKERLVVLHRAIAGSLERFMGPMMEHYEGKFPLWLNPVQVRILTLNDTLNDYAYQVKDSLALPRVEIDDRTESLGKKIRDAQLDRVCYMIIVGEDEEKSNSVSVRNLLGKEENLSLEKFSSRVMSEYLKRK